MTLKIPQTGQAEGEVQSHAVEIPEGYVLESDYNQFMSDPETTGTPDSLFVDPTPMSGEMRRAIEETQGIERKPYRRIETETEVYLGDLDEDRVREYLQMKKKNIEQTDEGMFITEKGQRKKLIFREPEPKQYAVEIPEGYILQTDNVAGGFVEDTELKARPKPKMLDQVKQMVRDFQTGGVKGRQERQDLVYNLAIRTKLPMEYVDANLDQVTKLSKLMDVHAQLTPEQKKEIAFTQGVVESLTFGIYNPDEVIQREFPIRGAAGKVVGGVAIYLTTGQVWKSLGLLGSARGLATGIQTYRAGQVGGAIFAAAPRWLPPAIMSGTTFATVGGVRKAVELTEKKDLNVFKIGGEVMHDFALGFGLGAVGSTVGYARRVILASGLGYTDGLVRGYSHVESGVQAAIFGSLEAVGGIGRDQALKAKSFQDVRNSLADYIRYKAPGKYTIPQAQRLATAYLDKLARTYISLSEGAAKKIGKTSTEVFNFQDVIKKVPTQFLEFVHQRVMGLMKSLKGAKGFNVVKIFSADLQKDVAKAGGDIAVKIIGSDPIKGVYKPEVVRAIKEAVILVSYFEPSQLVRDMDDNITRLAGGFPEPLANKGYTSKELDAVAKKVAEGKPLTEKQTDIYNDLLTLAEDSGIMARINLEDAGVQSPNVMPASPSQAIEAVDGIKVSDEIAEIELAWQGGVADLGDPQAAIVIQNAKGYDKYIAEVRTTLANTLGENFKVYRLMTENKYQEWKSGADIGPVGTSLSKASAAGFANLPGFAGKKTKLVEIPVSVNDVVMRGKPEEMEVVIDANNVSFDQLKVVKKPSKKTAGMASVPEPGAPVEQPDIPKSKGHIAFGKNNTEWIEKDGKIYRAQASNAIDGTGPNKGYRLGMKFEYPAHMADKIKKNLIETGDPQGVVQAAAPPPTQPGQQLGKGEVAVPILNQNQLKRKLKMKDILKKQTAIDDATKQAEVLHRVVRMWKAFLDKSNYQTNKFIDAIQMQVTPEEEVMLTFMLEQTEFTAEQEQNLPLDEITGIKDFVLKYNANRARLQPIADQLAEHYAEGLEFMRANIDNFSVQEIENYVNHIWERGAGQPYEKKQQQMASAINYFVTQNKFLKKRVIETYLKGIELGFKPRSLKVTDLIRIYDRMMNRTIANNALVKAIMKLRKNGVPLVERVDKAPINWAFYDHPALRKILFIPGKKERMEELSNEVVAVLNEMGLAIGRKIAPTVFGKPVRMLGVYRGGRIPPEVSFKKFFSNHTATHEIGHHLDSVLRLGERFLNQYKNELFALNKKRIEAFKGQPPPYGEDYARSPEEQIAEFFAFFFTQPELAQKLAPNATAYMFEKLSKDGVLKKLLSIDWEKGAKDLIQKQINTMVKLPIKVHPDLLPVLRIVFEGRTTGPVTSHRIPFTTRKFDINWTAAYEAVNGVLKKLQLSLSLFHHFALGETSIATMGIGKTFSLLNPKKIYKALANGEYAVYQQEETAMKWIDRGMQIGATADIPVKKIQGWLDDFAKKTENKAIIGHMSKFVATFNETWDKALWNYYHDTMKLYAAEHLALQHVDYTQSEAMIIKQEEEIAQFVNDTFGGQNWEVLMKSPMFVQRASWFFLSPDWTYSTLRQALSPTGVGYIHKETKDLRKKLGRWFWVKAALYFGVGISLMNMAFRKMDQKKHPDKYFNLNPKTGEKEPWGFWDFITTGNSIGKKTNLFVGRFADGSERYLRWGKQFRELPELLFDDLSFSPISATLKKAGSKTAPVLQALSIIFTGHSPSGFKIIEVAEAEGWERVFGSIRQLIKTPLPLSTRDLVQEGQDFQITDLAMPDSRGLTRAGAIRYFKIGLKKAMNNPDKDHGMRIITEVFNDCIINELPPVTLLNAAATSLKAERTEDLTFGLRTIEQVNKELEREDLEMEDRTRLLRLRGRMMKEKKEIEASLKAIDVFNGQIKRYSVEFGLE